MRRKLLIGLGALAVVIAALWGWNSSWLAPRGDGQVRLIAHRGVHQTFERAGLTNQTCTAERIHPPTHRLMENTITSIRAAFEAGADVIELDVHLTPDGAFAVFHDWTLDCRTEASGVTEETDMAVLRSLDIGHGYTADGGETFPLRGLGAGSMPTLAEVMDAFPDGLFLVNFKSARAVEGEEFAARAARSPEWRPLLFGAYGGGPPTEAALSGIGGLRGYTSRSARDCLLQYLALGWTGFVPLPCRGAYVPVPANFAWLMWGWPHRFTARMREAGSDVILLGPAEFSDPGSTGIDSLDQLSLIPDGFEGYVWTNRIEVVGPALKDGAVFDAARYALPSAGG